MLFQDQVMERRAFPEGGTIFKQGQRGDAAYIVESGRVVLHKTVGERRIRLATLERGALFGEMAVIDESPRMATAVALEPTVLVTIPRRMVGQKLEKTDRFVKSLLGILMENLRNVHAIYMKRPETFQEHVQLVFEQTETLRLFAEGEREGPYATEIARQLEMLDKVVDNLVRLALAREKAGGGERS